MRDGGLLPLLAGNGRARFRGTDTGAVLPIDRNVEAMLMIDAAQRSDNTSEHLFAGR